MKSGLAEETGNRKPETPNLDDWLSETISCQRCVITKRICIKRYLTANTDLKYTAVGQVFRMQLYMCHDCIFGKLRLSLFEEAGGKREDIITRKGLNFDAWIRSSDLF